MLFALIVDHKRFGLGQCTVQAVLSPGSDTGYYDSGNSGVSDRFCYR